MVARRDALAYCRRRMRRLLHIALALMVCFALPSCSMIGKGLRKLHWKKKKKADAAQNEEATRVIGVVEMVNPEQHFVLIRTQGRIAIIAGVEITAMDASGTNSKLKVTPEKKQDFLTADIVDGNPRVGNIVVFKADKNVVPPATPSQPAVPDPPLPFQPVEPPVQPIPLTPVSPSEFTRPGVSTPSPIPPQPVPPANTGATIPVPGQIQLPPVVR